MLTTSQLMQYLINKHSITVKADQTQHLRNIGYYHGYKGYRFIRTPNQRIDFTSFDEIMSLNEFDMELKALFYPKVMYIENALKSYVIEAVLSDCGEESLDSVFAKSVTEYKGYSPGSRQYKEAYTRRMMLKGKINAALIRDYSKRQQIVNHFFNKDVAIPIWAIFESLTLGEFGSFFSCTNKDVKLAVSSLLELPTNLDSDGKITQYMIYCIKDLRNAIAHNNIIFDTRFKTGKINERLINLLSTETAISCLDFRYVDAYVILITYILRKMGHSKSECIQFIKHFSLIIDNLRSNLPINVCHKITGTQLLTNMKLLNSYISKS